VRAHRQRADFGHFHFAVEIQEGFRVQAAQINAGVVNVDHVDVIIIDGFRARIRNGIKCVACPLIVLPYQVETPHEFSLVEVESEQAIEGCRCQEDRLVKLADLMAALQITVPVGSHDLEAAVITKKFVACGDQDIVTTERNTAKAPVGTAAFEVYVAFVPVDVLFDLLILEIDYEYATMTLTLFTTADYGRCDELWKPDCHLLVIL
jgi:hypothetical protein